MYKPAESSCLADDKTIDEKFPSMLRACNSTLSKGHNTELTYLSISDMLIALTRKNVSWTNLYRLLFHLIFLGSLC